VDSPPKNLTCWEAPPCTEESLTHLVHRRRSVVSFLWPTSLSSHSLSSLSQVRRSLTHTHSERPHSTPMLFCLRKSGYRTRRLLFSLPRPTHLQPLLDVLVGFSNSLSRTVCVWMSSVGFGKSTADVSQLTMHSHAQTHTLCHTLSHTRGCAHPSVH
jgi:hypothetical protein